MKNRQPIFSISIFVLGLLQLLKIISLLPLSLSEIIAYVFFFYGAATVFTNFGSERKGIIFLASVIFFVGTAVYVVINYEILSPFKIIFPSVLFVLSGAFLILFIDNVSQHVFLIISLVFGVAGYLSIAFYESSDLFELANRITFLIFRFWPVLLIFIGVGVLVNKSRDVKLPSSGI